MKLSIRLPMLFGVVITVAIVSMALITLRISSKMLEDTILDAIGNNNEANVDLLRATISDDPADRNCAREMGAADYIKKPCKKSELLERTGKILGSSVT